MSPSADAGSTSGLRILSPEEGDGLGTPFVVRYEITDFRVGQEVGYLRVSMVGIVDPIVSEAPLMKQAGTVLLGDKLFTGHRDLRFELAGPDHAPLDDPAAVVIVRDVTIAGGRGG
jgi:hypothetical protein